MINQDSNIYVPGWTGQVPLFTGEDFESAATHAYHLGKAYLPCKEKDPKYATFSIYTKKGIGMFANKDFGSAKRLAKLKLPRVKKEKTIEQLEIWEAA